MPKDSKKRNWLIWGSVISIVLFGTAMGIGALIGAFTKPDDDYIKIYAGDNVITDEDLNLGNDNISNEHKALMLEEQFYSEALFGTFDKDNVDNAMSDTYILQEGNDWNTPYISSTISNDELRTNFLKIKFLSDTQNSSVVTYLNTLYDSSEGESKIEIQQALKQLQTDANNAQMNVFDVTGLDLISNSSFEQSRVLIFDALKNDDYYLRDSLKDMMTYVYLWQEPSQSAYDYIFTREIVYNSPSMVSKMAIDGEEADLNGGSTYSNLEKIDGSNNTGINSSDWNLIYEEFKNNGILMDDLSYDQQLNTESINGFRGFMGIEFGTEAGSNIKSDYLNWSNTWQYNDTSDEDFTKANNYTNSDVLQTGNYYLSNPNGGADGKGAVIYNTDSDLTDPLPGGEEGERDIYVYSQLYPFTFRDTISEIDDTEVWTLDSEQFSLFANKDQNDNYIKVEGDDPTQGSEYIFDLWFGSDISIQGEIYVAESLISHDPSLSEKALDYWNKNGFYIELSGSYETDLLQYLPDSIIKDEK